jgi:hypothetical protein
MLLTRGATFQASKGGMERARRTTDLLYYHNTPLAAKKQSLHPVGATGFRRLHSQVAGIGGEEGDMVSVVLEGIVISEGVNAYPARAVMIRSKQQLEAYIQQATAEMPGVQGVEAPQVVPGSGRDVKVRLGVTRESLAALIQGVPLYLNNLARVIVGEKSNRIGEPIKLGVGCPTITADTEGYIHKLRVRSICRLSDPELRRMGGESREMGVEESLRVLVKTMAWEMAAGDCIREDIITLHPDISLAPKRWEDPASISRQNTPAAAKAQAAETTTGDAGHQAVHDLVHMATAAVVDSAQDCMVDSPGGTKGAKRAREQGSSGGTGSEDERGRQQVERALDFGDIYRRERGRQLGHTQASSGAREGGGQPGLAGGESD